jgi:hypothetical protein
MRGSFVDELLTLWFGYLLVLPMALAVAFPTAMWFADAPPYLFVVACIPAVLGFVLGVVLPFTESR